MRRRLQTMMITKTTKMAKTTPPTTAPATIPAVEEEMTSIRDIYMQPVFVWKDLSLAEILDRRHTHSV